MDPLVPEVDPAILQRVHLYLDHRVENSEPGELSMALWVSAALVAMVALSYWLNIG